MYLMIPEKEKEILKGLVVLVVIVAVAFLFIRLFGGGAPTSSTTEVDIIEESPKENMTNFPDGFPLEKEVSFSESFNYTPTGSDDQQSTLSYTSDLSLEENKKIFEEFLDENGFEIINQINEEGMAFYYAQKDGNIISLSIEEKGEEVLISTSYLDTK